MQEHKRSFEAPTAAPLVAGARSPLRKRGRATLREGEGRLAWPFDFRRATTRLLLFSNLGINLLPYLPISIRI